MKTGESATRRRVVGLGMAWAAAFGTGCAQSRGWEAGPYAGMARGRSALVLPGTVAPVEADFERFEFGRNDAAVGLVRPRALLATNQWPQPPRPLERRIRFSDWQQR